MKMPPSYLVSKAKSMPTGSSEPPDKLSAGPSKTTRQVKKSESSFGKHRIRILLMHP